MKKCKKIPKLSNGDLIILASCLFTLIAAVFVCII